MNLNCLTKREAVSLLEIIHSISICTNSENLKGHISKLKSIVPFESAGAMLNSSQGDKNQGAIVEFNIDYPPGFVEEYFKRGYAGIDPIVKDNMGDYGLKYWEDTLEKQDISRDLVGLIEDFGFNCATKGQGYSSGLKNPQNTEMGLISFYGLRRESRTETVLSLIIPHLHEAMRRGIYAIRRIAQVSRREREVLLWLANGKSSWDISIILNISERTVKFHIENIMKKLNAVNRTHAVAIAIREGLIELD